MSMFETLEQDYRRYSKGAHGNFPRYVGKALSNAGFRAVCLYRAGAWLYKRNHRFLAGMCQRLMHHLCHCWIAVSAEIGPGFLIGHVGGLVIGFRTRIGRNCDVRQNVTFGGNFQKKDAEGRTQPWVGDNVSFGVGCAVLGPVRIGSNSIVGANSVVTRDVPEGAIVSGVPAQHIKDRWAPESGRTL